MQESYLVHHGVKGMKWGIRRYQNEDGSLTAKGLKRYTRGDNGARRYIADRAIYESRKDKSKAAKNLRLAKNATAITTGGVMVPMGYIIGKEKGGKVGGIIGALGGYAVGHGMVELSARGGEWLGSKIGASLVDQKYIDIINRQIQSGKVGSLSEIEIEYRRNN